jgi:hypothetical protein
MEEKDRTISSKEEENQRLSQQLQEKGQANRQLEERVRRLQQESDKNTRQKEEKERQLGCVNQQLEASEQVVAQFERRIAELEQQLSQREQRKTKVSSRGKELTSFTLTWREGRRAPCRMNRWYDAVVDGNTVYFRYQGTNQIYSYDVISDSWSQLPDCVHGSGSITVINGYLTTVGGGSFTNYCSNALLSLTGKGRDRRWTKKFPPMPTRRRSTTSLCTGTALIVAGGLGGSGRTVLATVEVMDTETHQWSTAADLPQPIYCGSATICGDQIYMLGGISKDHDYMKSVYTCSVSTLLHSCVKHTQPERAPSAYKASVWKQLADLPIIRSTCESFHGRLLAISGKMDSGKYSTAVHMYNSTTNSWEIISHMTTDRCDCFTAVFPVNRLMVVGGTTDGGSTDIVEIATASLAF